MQGRLHVDGLKSWNWTNTQSNRQSHQNKPKQAQKLHKQTKNTKIQQNQNKTKNTKKWDRHQL